MDSLELTFMKSGAEKDAEIRLRCFGVRFFGLLDLFYPVVGAGGREKLSSPLTARPRAYAKLSTQALRVI